MLGRKTPVIPESLASQGAIVVFDNLGNEKNERTKRQTVRRLEILSCRSRSNNNTHMDLVKDSIMWSSYKERVEDALALRGDEGRDRLR